MAGAQSDEVGVTELHAPKNPAVDICFVHGLGGGSLSTWTSGEICWPRDLLKDDIPDARILAFGFESKVAQLQSKVSHNSFEQHAVNLSGNLGRSRIGETAKKRPLIFVAHSLGGLICVKALLMAHNSSEGPEKAVEESTRRIAFFGTPFSGSVKAKWGDVVRKVFGLWNETNHELLRDLQEDCSKLASLRDEFSGWLRQREVDEETKVKIICYAEEKSTGSVGEIVPKDSAHVQGHKFETINANHKEMCKFSSKDDPNYKIVLQLLKQWMQEVKEASSDKKLDNTATNNVSATFAGGTNQGMNAAQLNMTGSPSMTWNNDKEGSR